jgi:PAS domain S-box-containing protein
MPRSSKLIDIYLHSIDVGLLVVDQEGNILLTNATLNKLTGKAAEEINGKKYASILPEPPESRQLMDDFVSGMNQKLPICKAWWNGPEAFFYIKGYAQDEILDQYGKCRIIFIRDVSEEILYREKLDHQAAILSNVRDSIVVTDRKGIITYWNEAATELFGNTARQMLRQHITHFNPEFDIERFFEEARNTPGYTFRLEWPYLRPDGQTIWADVKLSPLYKNQELQGVIGVSKDITDKKKREQEARRQQQELSSIIDSQTSYLIRTDLEGKFTFVNAAFAKKYGYRGSLIGMNSMESILPEDHEKTYRMIEACLVQPGTMYPIEIRKPAPDGGYFTNYWEFVAITDEEGRPTEIQGVGYDISERKKTEEQILKLNHFNKLLLEISTRFINISYQDLQQQIQNALERVTLFTGFDRSFVYLFNEQNTEGYLTYEYCAPGIPPSGPESQVYPAAPFPWWMGKILRGEIVEIRDLGDLPEEASNEQQALQAAGVQSVVGVPIIYQDNFMGYAGFASLSSHKHWNGESTGLLKLLGAIFANSLYRTNTEKRLDEANQRYRLLAENITDMVSLHGGDAITHYVSPSCEALFGYQIHEILGIDATEFIHPNDREIVRTAIEQAKQEGSGRFIARLRKKNGEYIWIETIGKLLNNGQSAELIAVSRNIHQQQMAEQEKDQLLQESQALNEQLSANEEELRQNLETTVELNERLARSELHFKGLIEKSFDAIVVYNGEGIVQYASPSARKITGYEQMVGMHGAAFVVAEDLPEAEQIVAQILQLPGEQISFEQRVRRKDGEIIWVEAVMTNQLHEEAILGLVSNFRDITDKKLASLELQKSRASLNIAQSVSKVGSWEADLLSGDSYFSDEFYRILGLEPEEGDAPDFDYYTFVHPEDREFVKQQEREAFSEMKEIPLNYRIIDAFGKVKYIDAQNKILRDEQGNPVKMLGTIQDVSRERELEYLLDETGRIARVGGWEYDLYNNKLTWTKETYRIHALALDEILTVEKALAYYHTDDKPIVEEAFRRLMQFGEQYTLELRLITAEGNQKWVRTTAGPSEKLNGKISRVRGSIQDITERKQQEDMLKKYSERLSLAVKTARIGIWELDLDSGKLHWNDQLLNIYGISREEFEQDYAYWKTLVHPDDRENADAEVGKAIKGEQVFDVAFRILRPDGELRHISASAQPIFNDEGKIVRLLGVNLDVTSIKRNEEAIRTYTERLTLAVKTAEMGIWEMDLETQQLQWNEEITNLYGISSTELEENPGLLRSMIHPDDIEQAEARLKDAAQGKEVQDVEFRVIRPNGDIRFISASARTIKNNQHRPVYLVGTNLDITNIRQSQQALREYTERLKLATESAQIGVWDIDLASGQLIWDEHTCELFGVEPEKFSGRYEAWRERVHADDIEAAEEQFNHSLKTLEDYDVVYRVIRANDQQVRHLKVSARVITDEQQRPVRMIGINWDITKLKENEERLLEQNEALKKANTELDHFVYSTSHNLRAPLTSVMGIVQILREVPSEDERNRFIGLIEKSIHKLDETIQEINDYSKNTRVEVQRKPIDFNVLIWEIADSLTYMENANRLKLTTSIPEDLDFYSDSNRIKIIFNNLLSNAVKYFNPRQEHPFLRIVMQKKDGGVAITVEDNGIGIKQEYLDKIFNMFFRATNKASGSGLGLYIVREAVQKLGGKIEITSKLGEGSHFDIWLPNLK